MSLDQSIRFRERIADDPINIEGLYNFIMPSRILVIPTDPTPDQGQAFFYAINSSTGGFWFKNGGGNWIRLAFTFGTPGGNGITDIVNDGSGAAIFTNIVSNTAHLKTLTGTTNKITLNTLTNTIDFGININSSDVALGNVQNILSVFNQTFNPLPSNDISQGYSIGSFWQVTSGTQSILYICKNNSINNAVWTLIGPSSITTLLSNVGTGSHIYVDATSNPSQIRTLLSNGGKITFAITPDNNSINCGVNLNSSDVGLPFVQNIKNNFNASTNPGPSNDSSPTQNYSVGSIWLNLSPSLNMWVCQSSSLGAAIWVNIGPPANISSNDLAFARTRSGGNMTMFPASSTQYLLNIGPNTTAAYALAYHVGSSWNPTMTAVGPIFIVYTPTNGLAGNYYQISYQWVGYIASPSTSDTQYRLNFNVGDGTNPNGQLLIGGETQINIPAGSRFMTASKTFIYQSLTSGPISFYVSVRISMGALITLFTDDVYINFVQLI